MSYVRSGKQVAPLTQQMTSQPVRSLAILAYDEFINHTNKDALQHARVSLTALRKINPRDSLQNSVQIARMTKMHHATYMHHAVQYST